jgi:tripartite-type tricarboxylate transporter receptor subunit TctC
MFPDTPTVIESGVPGYDVSTWWGIVAPKSTPANVVTALNTAINSEAPALKDRFEREGASPFSGAPAAFGTMLQNELQGWRKVVSAGIKLD